MEDAEIASRLEAVRAAKLRKADGSRGADLTVEELDAILSPTAAAIVRRRKEADRKRLYAERRKQKR